MSSELVIRHLGKVRSLDELSLVDGESGYCISEASGPLLSFRYLAFAAMLELQSFECSEPGLIQEPCENWAARGIEAGGLPPYVVENIKSQLFRCFTIADESHHQREDDAVRSLEQQIERLLVACSDGSNEADPVFLGNPNLCGVGIEQIAKGRLRLAPLAIPRRHRDGPRVITRESILSGGTNEVRQHASSLLDGSAFSAAFGVHIGESEQLQPTVG